MASALRHHNMGGGAIFFPVSAGCIPTVPIKFCHDRVGQHLLGWMVSGFRSRRNLVLENLALRLHNCRTCTPTASPSIDRLQQAVLGGVETFWSGWRKPPPASTPRPVLNWHRGGVSS